MQHDNKTILLKANAAISKGDNEGFLDYCTDDTEWNFTGDISLKGKQAVRQWMSENYIAPPKFDVEKLIAGEDHVIAMGTITLKGKDGKSTTSPYCDVWRFRDGKMAELKAYVVG